MSTKHNTSADAEVIETSEQAEDVAEVIAEATATVTNPQISMTDAKPVVMFKSALFPALNGDGTPAIDTDGKPVYTGGDVLAAVDLSHTALMSKFYRDTIGRLKALLAQSTDANLKGLAINIPAHKWLLTTEQGIAVSAEDIAAAQISADVPLSAEVEALIRKALADEDLGHAKRGRTLSWPAIDGKPAPLPASFVFTHETRPRSRMTVSHTKPWPRSSQCPDRASLACLSSMYRPQCRFARLAARNSAQMANRRLSVIPTRLPSWSYGPSAKK